MNFYSSTVPDLWFICNYVCLDIDECKEKPGLCGENAMCLNKAGLYQCECLKGFQKINESCIG